MNENIVKYICKSAKLKYTKENKEIVYRILKETIRLGVFASKNFSEDTFTGLVPFVKFYIQEVVKYGKNPEYYMRDITEKLRKDEKLN